MCPLHVIRKFKADRVSGSFNTEGTHPANSRQIKQDYFLKAQNDFGLDYYLCNLTIPIAEIHSRKLYESTTSTKPPQEEKSEKTRTRNRLQMRIQHIQHLWHQVTSILHTPSPSAG